LEIMQQPQEFELSSPPADGISNVTFCPDTPLLLVSSWDATVRLYDVINNVPRTHYRHKAAVLDCSFPDKNRAFSGGLDRVVKMVDLNTNVETLLGEHEAAIKCVEYSAPHDLLVTGSWDMTLRTWDPRQRICISTLLLPAKAYSMSLAGHRLVVGCGQRHVNVYDLRAMGGPEQRRESSLKFQTRCIRSFVDNSGYALSSVEGRIAMEYFDLSKEAQDRKYAFKCHRTPNNGIDTVYPVNAIAFHPNFGTFASGGCDAMVSIWDGQNKKRVCQFHRYPSGISSLAFDSTGELLAIASSYTYEEGEKDHPPDAIFIRHVAEVEVKPKARA